MRKNTADEYCLFNALSHPQVVRYMCEYVVEHRKTEKQIDKIVQSTNNAGYNVLHVCARKNYVTSLDIIISHIKDRNKLRSCINENQNDDNSTPLHLAVENHNVEAVRQLVVIHEVEFERKNIDGDTALHLAIKLRNGNICEILKHADTDRKFNIKNNNKMKPKQLAKKLKLLDVYNHMSSPMTSSPTSSPTS
jgi:ankyrin repeat protein